MSDNQAAPEQGDMNAAALKPMPTVAERWQEFEKKLRESSAGIGLKTRHYLTKRTPNYFERPNLLIEVRAWLRSLLESCNLFLDIDDFLSFVNQIVGKFDESKIEEFVAKEVKNILAESGAMTQSLERSLSTINEEVDEELELKRENNANYDQVSSAAGNSKQSEEHTEEFVDDMDGFKFFTYVSNLILTDYDNLFGKYKDLTHDSYLNGALTIYESKNGNRAMEDRMCVIEDLGKYIENPKLEGFLFLAVFDGHQGFHCSQFLQTYIPYIFSECAEENFDEEQIKCGLEELDQAYLAKCEIEGYTCGSTALVAIISKSKLYSAWLGDCEAHLIEEEFKSVLPVVKPHKLSDPEERKLLEAKGSNVVFVESSQMYRLNAQLAVSRSIGDIFHKNQMIREPSTKQVDNLENYRYLVMACDGIFDVIRGEELSEILNSNSLDVNSNIAEYIVKLSIARKSGDNLSAIVLNLNKYMKS